MEHHLGDDNMVAHRQKGRRWFGTLGLPRPETVSKEYVANTVDQSIAKV